MASKTATKKGGGEVKTDQDKRAADKSKEEREKWLGVYIAVLAVLLAVCGLGGGNAAKNATLKNIEVTNNWAFFQAKNLRSRILG
ncbi:MAG: DUF4337 family protein, partial [Hyphomicrobiaceae bacterium]